MSKANAESFLHFYSNWITKESYYDVQNHALNIEFYDETGDLAFENHVGPALFQVNRMALSASSLYINEVPFVETVKVKLNKPIPAIDPYFPDGIPLKVTTIMLYFLTCFY